ncbi:MAG TPA: hypothetical protein VGQ94_00775 [Terriglobales bacterium]|nr:hypothetical protein [Terriglobales bacterium]
MLRDLKRVLLAAGMILALSGFALAHDERSRDSDGYQQGYNAGFQHGRADRDRRAGYDPRGDANLRGNRGYDPGNGNRDQYAAAYREGYQSGYDDGYNGRNGRSNDAYGRGGYGRDEDDDDDRGGYGRDNRNGSYGSGRNGSYGRRGSSYNNVAYDTGYRDGIDGAQSDIRENKRFDVNDHGWYRDADHGYSSRYGSKKSYRQQYRQGYETGYRETFDRSGYSNGGYGNGYPTGGYGNGRGGTSDIAYSTGYSDGMVGARKDMLERKSPDPTRHDWYKDANRGYDGRAYGNREDYKQRYRQAYMAGYNDAYSGRGRGF